MNRLSLDDFKKWMKEHSSEDRPSITKPINPLIGLAVESKLPAKRLLPKMEEPSADAAKLVEEFLDQGGVITESEDKRFCIRVNSGTFYVHRAYVTRA
jgi:hypothetical protein